MEKYFRHIHVKIFNVSDRKLLGASLSVNSEQEHDPNTDLIGRMSNQGNSDKEEIFGNGLDDMNTSLPSTRIRLYKIGKISLILV